MRRKNNNIAIFIWVIRIVIFLSAAILLWLILDLIMPYMLAFVKNVTSSDESNINNRMFSILGALLDVVIAAVLTSYIESIYTARLNLPRIFITMPQTNLRNVSGVKVTHSCAQHLCIKIGKSESKFRVIYATVRNTGNRIISRCMINKQVLNLTLGPDQTSPLYFIVYEDVDGTKEKKKYKVSYCIQDDQGNSYVGKYCMRIDYEESIATFSICKRMRRSVLTNALSNL